MPDHARRFMVIDPEARAVSYLDHDLGVGAAKTFGGVLAPNGKIYSGLAGAGKVWVIDPAHDSVEEITGLPDGLRYVGGVLGPDGKIYCVPSRQVPLFVLDPETRKGALLCRAVCAHGSLRRCSRFTCISWIPLDAQVCSPDVCCMSGA